MKLDLNITLSDKQEEILKACTIGNGIQYVTVCTGRQVGKSTIALITALKWTFEHKNYSVGIYLPVYKQCRNLFKRIQKALTPLIDDGLVEVNKSELTITLNNGSTIMFLTSENDNMRSFTFDAIVVDEACFGSNKFQN